MPKFVVSWQVEVVADTPEAAAIHAYHTQRDPRSIATVYDVKDADDPNAEFTPIFLNVQIKDSGEPPATPNG